MCAARISTLVLLFLTLSVFLTNAFAYTKITREITLFGHHLTIVQGCVLSPSGCEAKLTGNFFGNILVKGTLAADVSMEWQHSFSNEKGGYCAPTKGTATLSGTHGNKLFTSFTGTICDKGIGGATLPHIFKGTFLILGGEGTFAHASGEGKVTGHEDGKGNTHFNASGDITYHHSHKRFSSDSDKDRD